MLRKMLGAAYGLAAISLIAMPHSAMSEKLSFTVSGYMTGGETSYRYMEWPLNFTFLDKSGYYSFVVQSDPFIGSTNFYRNMQAYLDDYYIGGICKNITGQVSFDGTTYTANNVQFSEDSFCRGTPEYLQNISRTELNAPTMNIKYWGTGPDYGPPVPEPATWLFLIFGFGIIGAVVRGAKKRASCASGTQR